MEIVLYTVESWFRLHLANFGLGILSAMAVLVVGMIAARLVSRAAYAAMLHTPIRSRALLVNFVTRTAYVVIAVFAGVTALSQVGVDVGPLIAGIGITGFIVGFAFKDSLSNLAAGLLLLFYQPFEVGDFVETAGQSGEVMDMSIAATELRMPDGRLAIVPNSRIWNAHIINFNRLGSRRLEWSVPIPNSADLGAAMDAMREAVRNEQRLLGEPSAEFVVNALGPATVELLVRAWVQPQDVPAVSSDMRRALKDAVQSI